MNNQKSVFDLIKSISGQLNLIAVPRIYIELLDGDINSAILLSQIIYWSDKSKINDGWFYKTFNDWYDEIGLTQYKIKRASDLLEKKQFIETKLKRANGAPTIHYKLNVGLLTNSIIKFLDNRETSQSDYQVSSQSDYQETEKSLTENTHDINTENTPVVSEQRPNIYSVYENEIGTISPMIAEELKDIEKTYPGGWFEMAVREAKLSSTRVTLNYVRRILDRWKAEGLPNKYRNNGTEKKEQYTGKILLPDGSIAEVK